MTLDLDNMTQAEFDKQMAEIKERNPNIFQLISDFLDRPKFQVEVSHPKEIHLATCSPSIF
ncbi:Uncharacterised protein [Streptococcus pneumoniae]|nr:Uncharacterised protein [Streptococcus pneumoniae]VNN11490.1 Uncharacterised protein [Streptococcus pneumoniae]VQH59377.1 Uncharacterised protein [Streptococcus pneumoniae]